MNDLIIKTHACASFKLSGIPHKILLFIDLFTHIFRFYLVAVVVFLLFSWLLVFLISPFKVFCYFLHCILFNLRSFNA